MLHAGSSQAAGALAGVRASDEGEDIMTAASKSSVGEIIVAEHEGKPLALMPCLNSGTGTVDWQQAPSDIMHRTIATSQLRGMLHDTQRCVKYRRCIFAAVAGFAAAHGRAPVVLDIGAGSGLLSLFAREAGAAAVYACEMFEPLACIAQGIVAGQGAGQGALGQPLCEVTVLAGKSTDVVVGGSGPCSIPVKADLLVSELFDSVLLGEGLIPTLRDARERLLHPHALVIPRRARVWGQAAQSDALAASCDTHGLQVAGLPVVRTEWGAACGARTALPLHVRALRPQPTASSEPQLMWEFDFQNFEASAVPAGDLAQFPGSRQAAGVHWYISKIWAGVRPHGLIAWWDVHLDTSSQAWQAAASTAAGLKPQEADIGSPSALPDEEQLAGDPRPDVFSTHPAPWSVPAASWDSCRESMPSALSTSLAPATWPWPWQDHWVQTFLPLPPIPRGAAEATGHVLFARSDLTLWLRPATTDGQADGEPAASATGAGSAADSGGRLEDSDPAPASCTCGGHQVYHPLRLAALRSDASAAQWETGLHAAFACVNGADASTSRLTLVADVSSGTAHASRVLGAGKTGAVSVFSLQYSTPVRTFSQAVLAEAGCADAVSVGGVHAMQEWMQLQCGRVASLAQELGQDAPDLGIHILTGEAWYPQMHSAPLWALVSLWLRISSLRGALAACAVISPSMAYVRCVVVRLEDFWRGYAPAGKLYGIDHSGLDEAMQPFMQSGVTLPVPMWEYEMRPLSQVTTLAAFPLACDASAVLPEVAEGLRHDVPLTCAGEPHAVVTWVDYNTAPTKPDTLSTAEKNTVASFAPPQVQYAPWEGALAGSSTPCIQQEEGSAPLPPRGPASGKQTLTLMPYPWTKAEAGDCITVELKARQSAGAWLGLDVQGYRQ